MTSLIKSLSLKNFKGFSDDVDQAMVAQKAG